MNEILVHKKYYAMYITVRVNPKMVVCSTGV